MVHDLDARIARLRDRLETTELTTKERQDLQIQLNNLVSQKQPAQ